MPNIILEGYLYKNKKFHPSRGWNKRWFVLIDAGSSGKPVLDYYKNQTKKKRSNSIDLETCAKVQSYNCTPVTDNYRWVFYMKTADKQYYLVASSELDMTRWINSICRICGLSAGASDEDDDIDPPVLIPGSRISTISRESDANSHRTTVDGRSGQVETSHFDSVRNIHGITSQELKKSKEDNPYLYLSECLSRAPKIQRPESAVSYDSGRTSGRSSIERQLSVPEESPPPPPELYKKNVEDDIEEEESNLYKAPIKVVVYGSTEDKAAQKKRISSELSSSDAELNTAYDVPKLAVNTLRLEMRYNSPAEENYDHIRTVPKSVSSAVSASSDIPWYERKSSLPSDSSNNTYDHVPKLSSAGRSSMSSDQRPLITNHLTSYALAHSGASALYQLPPPRPEPLLPKSDSAPSCEYFNLGGVHSPSARIAIGNATLHAGRVPSVPPQAAPLAPPMVDRHNKPSTQLPDLAHRKDVGTALGHESSPRRVGSPADFAAFPAGNTANFHCRSASAGNANPQRPQRSTSQEDLSQDASTLKDDNNYLRRHNGTRTMPRQRKPPAKPDANFLEYIDVTFTKSKESPDICHTKKCPSTLPRPSDSLKVTASVGNGFSTTEYREVDVVKTKALQKTWKH